MFLHFDPHKIALPPILGGPAPQLLKPTTPLLGSSLRGTRHHSASRTDPLPLSFGREVGRVARNELNHAGKQGGNDIVSKKRLKQYENRDQLIQALGDSFRESQIVDFAACYRTHEPNVSHKQRIQATTHEIWKATGYRFTVKDHPPAKDGHKTRLWCSQDESHRNKPSKTAHRVAGDGTAKTRYPCRSGLLISSRDDQEPGGSYVVIRMHHHLAHEPYYDHTLPPEMTQSIWQNLPKSMDIPSASMSPVSSSTILPPVPSIAAPASTGHLIKDDILGFGADDLGAGADLSNQPNSSSNGNLASISSREASITPALTPQLFQQRMRKHIADIRDFCCGLEYQLQFNDYKLLEVLESEGSQFLKLVHQCLEIEGRLRHAENQENTSIV